jgi:hypothetical protein
MKRRWLNDDDEAQKAKAGRSKWKRKSRGDTERG